MLAGLGSLLDKSLIQRDGNETIETHFAMLETTREYAFERLVSSDEAEALCRRHAAYYLALAEQAAPELTGSHQATWLKRLGRAYDNLRAALSWLREQHQTELGLRLGGALARFWATHGYIGEGREWLESLIAQSVAVEVPVMKMTITEVARVIFGIDRADAGEIRIGNESVHISSPKVAMQHGLAYVPEDRRQQGLVMDFSIERNIALASLDSLRRAWLIPHGAERRFAKDWAIRLKLKYGRLTNPVW